MDVQNKANIVRYMTLAAEALGDARLLLTEARHRAAVSRAYYAIFYAASAVLLSQGLKRSKHAGVQAAFSEFFVKPGLIETEYARIYKNARESRELGDYELLFTPGADVAEQLVADAERFVARMEQYLRERGIP